MFFFGRRRERKKGGECERVSLFFFPASVEEKKGGKKKETHHFRLLWEKNKDLVGGVVLLRNQDSQVVSAGDVAVRVAERVEGGVEVVLGVDDEEEEVKFFCFVFFLDRERSVGVSCEGRKRRRRPETFDGQLSLSSSFLLRFSSPLSSVVSPPRPSNRGH